MSRAAILEQVATTIEAVDGVENVHRYERWATNWSKVLELLRTADGSRYHGWMLTRRQSAKRQVTLGTVEIAHVFSISGLYGLRDVSNTEAVFQSLVDDIEAALGADETLAGTCATTHPDWGPMSGAVGLQIDDVSARMFGEVLCHFAECRLCAIELRYD